MEKHVFFVNSLDEAKKTQEIIESSSPSQAKVIIISSNPSVNLFFERNKTAYKDLSTYFPKSKKVKHIFEKVNNIIKLWYQKYNGNSGDNEVFQQVGFSLHNYLAEIMHALETSKNIIEKERPTYLYVSNCWPETPFKRYQTENFSAYQKSFKLLSKENGIKTFNLNVNISENLATHFVSFILGLILLTIKVTYKQIFSRKKIIKLENLIIMANYYQLENLIPLLKDLRNKLVPFSLIGNANLEEIKSLSKINITFYPISNLVLIALQLSKIRLFSTINYFLNWIKYRKKLKHFFNRFNKYYWDLISAKFLYYFLYEFPLISDLITNAQNTFDNKKILLTMATTDTISHSISYAAKLSQLRVLELQHGMLFIDVDQIHRLNDYYILWGPRARDIITNRKSHLNNYPVAGFSLFDKYNENNFSILRPIIRKRFGFSQKIKILLILAVFPTGLARINQKISPFQFIDMIFQTVGHLNGKWKIIFRPHPSFKADWIKDMAKQRKIDFYYDDRKLPIEETIAASDIVIANPTTPILDAMFLKKPVLTSLFHYDLGGAFSKSFLIKSNATVLFDNAAQLKSLVDKFTSDPYFKREMKKGQKIFLEEYCMAFSGSSTARTVKTILDILRT